MFSCNAGVFRCNAFLCAQILTRIMAVSRILVKQLQILKTMKFIHVFEVDPQGKKKKKRRCENIPEYDTLG